jgi:hypothetical protein
MARRNCTGSSDCRLCGWGLPSARRVARLASSGDARRKLTESVWAGARLPEPPPSVKPQPTGSVAELARVLTELGNRAEQWSLHLETQTVIDLLRSCDALDPIRRATTHEQLARLMRAADHCAKLLADSSDDTEGDLVVDGVYHERPKELAAAP